MLPNLIIIGAQKSGTTSLHYYLSLHPQILMSKQKELEFFIEERNWPKGLTWYESNFVGKAKVFGESSPNYTNCVRFPGVPERMYSVIPEAKLVYIVRDPIERMISQYIHQYSDERENRPVEEALGTLENNQYLYRSLYYTQLTAYLEYYPASQILVIPAEDLDNNRQAALNKVFEFLGVNRDFYTRLYAIRRHSTARKRRKTEAGMRLAQTAPMRLLRRLPQHLRWPLEDLLYTPFSRNVERPRLDEDLKRKLIDRLREDVSLLRKFTGYSFDSWCV
jgi:hypothetical protein